MVLAQTLRLQQCAAPPEPLTPPPLQASVLSLQQRLADLLAADGGGVEAAGREDLEAAVAGGCSPSPNHGCPTPPPHPLAQCISPGRQLSLAWPAHARGLLASARVGPACLAVWQAQG